MFERRFPDIELGQFRHQHREPSTEGERRRMSNPQIIVNDEDFLDGRSPIYGNCACQTLSSRVDDILVYGTVPSGFAQRRTVAAQIKCYKGLTTRGKLV